MTFHMKLVHTVQPEKLALVIFVGIGTNYLL